MPSIKVVDEAHWLSLREAHIGGSDIASLFYEWLLPDGRVEVNHVFQQPTHKDARVIACVSSFKTGYRLWQEKAGRLKPDDFTLNDRVQAGIHLEPAIAEWSREKFNWKIRKVKRYVEHDEVPYWGASLDYELNEKGSVGHPVEIKTADGFIFKEQWQVEDDEIVMPPLPYVLQIQHQIGATNSPKGYIVVCVGGNQLYRGSMDRHEPTQKKIAEAISAFHQAIKGGIEPVWLADYETVADQFRFAERAKATDLTNDKELPALCREYMAVQEQMKNWEAHRDILKGQIAAKAGDAVRAVINGYTLTWPVITREEKMIPAKVQKALTYRGGLTIKESKD